MPYKNPIPIHYRNFVSLKGVQSEGVKYYGGSVEFADYCPYNQEFEWKFLNWTNQRRDSRCELFGNSPPADSNYVLEVYGNHSKCFDHGIIWTERKCGQVRSFLQYMAGCYQVIIFLIIYIYKNIKYI